MQCPQPRARQGWKRRQATNPYGLGYGPELMCVLAYCMGPINHADESFKCYPHPAPSTIHC